MTWTPDEAAQRQRERETRRSLGSFQWGRQMNEAELDLTQALERIEQVTRERDERRERKVLCEQQEQRIAELERENAALSRGANDEFKERAWKAEARAEQAEEDRRVLVNLRDELEQENLQLRKYGHVPGCECLAPGACIVTQDSFALHEQLAQAEARAEAAEREHFDECPLARRAAEELGARAEQFAKQASQLAAALEEIAQATWSGHIKGEPVGGPTAAAQIARRALDEYRKEERKP